MSSEHERSPSNPVPNAHEPTIDYGEFTQAFLVGSPESSSVVRTPRLSAATWFPENSRQEPSTDFARSSQPLRPSLDHRNASSPFLIRRRQLNVTPSVHRHGITSAVVGGSLQTERSWSLFEQLMENEGQLRSPTPVRRSSRSQLSDQIRGDQHSEARGLSSPLENDESSMRKPSSPGRLPTPTFESHEPRASDHHARDRLPSLHEYDLDDYPSDSSGSDDSGTATPTAPAPRPLWTRVYDYIKPRPLPTLYRNVLKCAIAYFIGSLFTFSPHLSGLMSDLISYVWLAGEEVDNHHLAGIWLPQLLCIITPLKLGGAMLEADLFCLAGLLYAAFVCLVSMDTFWWLELRIPYEWDWLLNVAVIVWIGAAMSIVAWMKLWMANPSFNTACSMTAIIIFIVVIKEGGFQMLLQVSTIIFIGASISNVVCFCLWPQSALAGLRCNMEDSLGSFGVLLGMLVGVFLGEAAEYDSEDAHMDARSKSSKLSYEKIKKAVDGHQSTFTNLKKSLAEARTEWVIRGWDDQEGGQDSLPTNSNTGSPGLWSIHDASGRRAYEDAVDSLNRLAQHLNGLRSGTRLQYELAKAGVLAGRGKQREAVTPTSPGIEGEDEDAALLRAAAAMFGDLVDELGPPLNALSKACTTSLSRLREAFILARRPTESSSSTRTRQRGRNQSSIQPQEFFHLVDRIEGALKRFESTSDHAVLRLYRRPDVSASSSSSYLSPYHNGDRSIHESEVLGHENALLTSPDNESVFLVYFFIFTLQEFARELMSLVDAMSRIYAYEKRRANRKALWRRAAAWVGRVLSFVTCGCFGLKNRRDGYGLLNARNWRGKRRALKRRISAYIIPLSRKSPSVFPKIRPHAPNTIQTPGRQELSFFGRLGQRLWAFNKRLKERDTKYAIKAGMATALLAAPAFFEQTRGIFVDYWGDWGIGIILCRDFALLSALFGAAVAATIYSAFPENPYVLSIFGFFFSLPCFYYAVAKPQYLSASRFVLLTYNLTCLYCYNARDIDVPVLDVALHRALAVTAGVVWAGVVSRLWWPAEARRELGHALGDFCVNIGWLYTRLVASNSFAPEFQGEGEDNADTSSRIEHTRLNNSIQEFMAMELHLQIKLIELQGLLAQAQHEPRLKGPFPVKLYRDVLTSLQTILDKLHSMRCVTTREEWYTSVRRDFIVPVNKERHEMVGNIILGFTVLASAFRLKAPLPPYLPPAEKARRRLVNAIRKLDVVRNREVKGSRQLLYFAYVLTMKGVTEELERLGHMLQEAFGVIGQNPSEFEALFPTAGNRQSTRTISDIA